MQFIGFEREEEAIAWAAERLDTPGHGFCRAMSSVTAKGDFALVVVLSNFTPSNVDVSVAGNPDGRWIRKCEFIKMFNCVFGYIFDQLKAKRATGLVARSNVRCCKFISGLGFALEGQMRKAFNDDDLCIYGLLAEEFHQHPWHKEVV